MKKVLAGLLLGCSLLFFANLHAEAADHSYQFVLGNDQDARGKYTTTKQNFTLEDYWDTDSVKFKMIYKVTQLLEQEASTITFSINDVPFYSFKPDKNDPGTKEIEVEVPKNKLKKGANVLTIEGYVYTTLSDERCTIDETPANWLHIDKATTINVQYNERAFKNTIADFSKRFTGIDTVKNHWSGIFTSAKNTDAELESGLRALSAYAARNPLDDEALGFSSVADSERRGKTDYQLVIAKFKNLDADFQNDVTDSSRLKEEALVKLVNHSGKHILIVTSKNDAALETAGRLLANKDLTAQLGSDEKWVKQDEDVATEKTKIDREIKLSYAGDKVKGIGHVEQEYFVKVPSNRMVADGTKVNLRFRYSQNLDFKHSLVTILINGKPIGSKKLTADKANNDSFTINVPKDMNIIGNFNVTVAFDLILEDNYCGFIGDSEIPWGYVTSDTTFDLHTSEKQELLFNYYPYPFITDGAYENTLVVLPNKVGLTELATLENLFNLLGQFTDGNNGTLNVVNSKNLTNQNNKQNMIAIGKMTSNQVLKKANPNLYFAYNKTGTRFVSNEKMKIDSSYGDRIGSVQLLPSVYNKNRALLAVTGATPEMTELGSTLLSSSEMLSKTYGDGVLIDQDENIHAYRFKKVAGDTESFNLKRALEENSSAVPFLIVAALALGILVVAVVLLVRKYRKK
ncbi:hypothetical protein MFLO_09457 [Listeria floridensis FSL S10-1187]|uniref:Cellulose synthase catalytic subunit n=1 Tax=Listeria floridensis FSL S10-1187 TaxID=1265817 RepID=A0ABP3AXC9_9LIST|nr:cellulose biosynthesis cyclic di-GMP-binding regulatory protein BcsB [Listeria floridensis]EUJ31264.1 hypothetical protein MFLO_09457 [Listeria floridensis FSL S10-1187]